MAVQSGKRGFRLVAEWPTWMVLESLRLTWRHCSTSLASLMLLFRHLSAPLRFLRRVMRLNVITTTEEFFQPDVQTDEEITAAHLLNAELWRTEVAITPGDGNNGP
jgi:hypothetical protein